MNNLKYEFAELSPAEIQKIQQAEQSIKQNQDGEIILIAYKKQ